jgi:hypothetical protein
VGLFAGVFPGYGKALNPTIAAVLGKCKFGTVLIKKDRH